MVVLGMHTISFLFTIKSPDLGTVSYYGLHVTLVTLLAIILPVYTRFLYES